jgi:hypothetical protein
VEDGKSFMLNTLRFLIFLLLIAGMASWATEGAVRAQAVWSLPQRIPDYDHPRAPFLVSDQNRTVHAFNHQLTLNEEQVAILYRQWTLEQGWTPPIDILLWPASTTVQVQGVFLDQSGMLHLIVYVGTPRSGEMYYSQAPVTDADKAWAWGVPEAVGAGAGPLPFGVLAGDGAGNLTVLYDGQAEGLGVYEVHSTDGGSTWSAPVIAALTYGEDRWPASIRITLDERGDLHAVWSVVNARGQGEEVYYAQREAGGERWGTPVLLATRAGDDYSTNWPSIIAYRDDLFVIYQDGFPATRWMRRSTDGGESWEEAVRPFPHIGEYEHAVLLKDSAEVLHMVLGNRVGDPEVHGMWHSIWLGGRWSDLEPIVSGPVSADFDPSAPQAVISQGNVMLVTWWMNTPEATMPWYSYATLDAPQLDIVPPPTPPPLPTPTVDTTPTPSRQPTSRAQTELFATNNDVATQRVSYTAMPLIVGVAPAVALLAATFFVWRFVNRTR